MFLRLISSPIRTLMPFHTLDRGDRIKLLSFGGAGVAPRLPRSISSIHRKRILTFSKDEGHQLLARCP